MAQTIPIPAGATIGAPGPNASQSAAPQTIPIPQGATIGMPGPSTPPPPANPMSALSKTSGISAQPPNPNAIAGWTQNVMNDIRYGTDTTGVGTVLKKMGAHGVYNGNSQAVGEFMASMPLGLMRMVKGGSEQNFPGQQMQGIKDTVAGAAQAMTMPASVIAPEGTASAIDKVIPSASRAGTALNEVKAVAGGHTIDVGAVGDVALRAKQVADSGNYLPKVIRNFISRATDPDLGPITFAEGRDFYSNASRVSADEALKMKGQMKALMPEFASKLGDALNEAADRAGRLDQYVQAMKEYSNAMKLKTAGKAAADLAVKGIVGAGGATGGYEAIKKLMGR